MSNIFSTEPDPLARLLAPPSLSGDDPLRQSLLRRTQRRLRWQRRFRQLTAAAALALCYIAGMGTMQVVRLGPTPDGSSVGHVFNVPEASGTLKTCPTRTALQREWQALDSTTDAGQLYRQAGDQYLEEEADPLSALRCYGNALDAGADLTPSPSDNGLLMVIKLARTKESRHAIP